MPSPTARWGVGMVNRWTGCTSYYYHYYHHQHLTAPVKVSGQANPPQTAGHAPVYGRTVKTTSFFLKASTVKSAH